MWSKAYSEKVTFTGFGDEYFKRTGDAESKDDKKYLEGYKSVLNSKTGEESLVWINLSTSHNLLFPYLYI
jgi:hypothetical protein